MSSAGSRRATTSATRTATIKSNVEHFLALNGVETDGGRIVMAANARALGHCFNPISVFWCHRRDGDLAGVVVEVHNTYGDRHAYLVHPDGQGRARTDEADVRLAVPRHRRLLRDRRAPSRRGRLHVSVTLHSDDGAVFSASLDGEPTSTSPLRSAPAALRGTLLIHAHGIWLWARRLGIRTRPAPPATGRRLTMTTTPSRPATAWPGLAQRPLRPQGRRLRPDRPAALPRGGTPAARDRARRQRRPPGRGAPAVPRCGSSDPAEFFARVGRDGLIGFGEAYLTGAWDAEDLGGFLTVLAAELPRLIPEPLQKLRAAYVRRPPRAHQNTEHNTRDNIAHHYDLSNDLFRLFLDETLSYSSALYDTSMVDRGDHLEAAPPEGHDSEPLAEAQARKIERLLDQTGVGAGTRVLEIGTGWGELAIRAARRGATVHSVTLSKEQLDLAESSGSPRPGTPTGSPSS